MGSEFQVKTRDQVRVDILRVISNGAELRGYPSVNITQGSDYYRLADGVGQELEALYAEQVIAFDRLMPDTTSGDDLVRWLNSVGLDLRPAGSSTGNITLDATQSTVVAAAAELLDPSGSRFQVTTGGLYSPGDAIPVASATTGVNTNLDPGTTLRWVTPPAFAANTAVLDAAGATGGVDAEDDDTARDRLLQRLREPPAAGNAADVAGWGETVVAAQRGFVYPACNGPSTTHVAAVGYASSSTTRSRALNAINIGKVRSAIEAQFPEHAELVVTTVLDVAASLAFYLQLPAAQSAIPSGIGGGWVDGEPCPRQGTGFTFCPVGTLTSTTTFQIQGLRSLPIVGQRIAYVDNANFKLYIATITALGATGGSGPYTAFVTIDTPFVNLQTGDWIFPAAENTQTYVDSVLGSFALLGPGEKTDQAGLLPRAYRRPRQFQEADSRLGSKFLRALEDSSPEVQGATWAYQNGGVTSPSLPASIVDPPRIFTPNRIAFYPSDDE